MSAIDVIRSSSVNFWNTDFQKEQSANNLNQASIFLTQDKKFKNMQLSSALSGVEFR